MYQRINRRRENCYLSSIKRLFPCSPRSDDRLRNCSHYRSRLYVSKFSLQCSQILIGVDFADACYVVYQYSKRLTKQRLDKERLSTTFNSSGATYQPVKSTEDTYPLTHGKTYPYADAPNSFGSSVPHSGGPYDNNAGAKV